MSLSADDYKYQRDLLGREIIEIAILLGIARPDLESASGPEILILCEDIKKSIKGVKNG